MWLRFCIACVFLCTLVSAASISSREDGSEDEEETKSNIPLVVSIPSKVFRANKFNENDVRSPLLSAGRPKQSVTRPPAVATAATTERAAVTSTEAPVQSVTEPVVVTTTTEKVTAVGEQRQTFKNDEDSLKDIEEPSRDDDDDGKNGKVAASEKASKGVDVPTRDSKTPEDAEKAKKVSEDTEEPASTTTAPTTTTATSKLTADGDVSTTAAPSSSPTTLNNSSAKALDEVVERDYGLSVGTHHDDDEINGHSVTGDDEVEGSKSVQSDSRAQKDPAEEVALVDNAEPNPGEHADTEVAEEHASADAGTEQANGDIAEERADGDVAVAAEEVSAHAADDRIDADVSELGSEADVGDEVDPLEDAAQASEVDYAVVAPAEQVTGDFGDLSAVQSDQPRAVQLDDPEDVGTEVRKEGKVQDKVSVRVLDAKNDTGSNETEVKTSSTVSVAVLHPLGEFKTAQKVPLAAVPKEKGMFKKAAGKSNGTFATVVLPEDETASKVTESSFIVLLDSEVTDLVNSTTSKEELVASELSPSTVAPAVKQHNVKPKGSGKKFVQSDRDGKDLEPAESAQDSPSVLNIDGGEEDTDVGEVSALTSDLDAGAESSVVDAAHDDPELVNDEGEYEYVYEYIDVNSTDIPENLPEGSLIVSDDGRLVQPPRLETKPPKEEAIQAAVSDNGSQVLDVPSAARPPSFRTFEPPIGINTADLSLIEGAAINASAVPASAFDIGSLVGQPVLLPAVQPAVVPGVQPATFRPDEASIPFIAGIPESPVYFVGIQREKLPSGSVVPPETLPGKDAVSVPSSNVLEDGKQEKVLGVKGDREQLNALYALSRALPLDDNLPFLVADLDENVTVVLPPHLPDPFSEELLGDVQSTVPELTATPPAFLTTSTTTEIPSTEVTEPLPETTLGTTEAAAAVDEDKPTTRRGSRPGVRRRTSTTSTAAFSTETEATTTASPAPRRSPRPNRVGGRRKTSVSPSNGSTRSTTAAPEASTEAVSTEKPSGNDRSRFGSRGRGRPTTRPATTTTEDDTAAAEKDKDSNAIGNGNKRPGASRRIPTRTTTTTAPSSTDKDGSARSSTAAPVRGRRPQFRRTNGKGAEEKATTAAATSDESTPADGTTTTRKQPSFRPRGRGRFSKTKATAAGDEAGTTEHGADETHSAAESSATELKEESPVANGETDAAEVASPATEALVEGDGLSTEGASTEASGPPRKFPPRFRPGARARVPHRSTDATNGEPEN